MAVDIIDIDMEKIEIYKDALCEILDLDSQTFSTMFQNADPEDCSGDLARYNLRSGDIYLFCDRIEKDRIPYIIAHEVRHRWQHLNGWLNENGRLIDTDKDEEIDAFAFAIVVADELHFLTPNFRKKSEDFNKRVFDAASEIKAELGQKVSKVFTPELREKFLSWIV